MPFATKDKRNGINLYSSSMISTHRINCAASEPQEDDEEEDEEVTTNFRSMKSVKNNFFSVPRPK